MQPVTISRRQAPPFLCCAISRIVSIDSCFAESMKAHVLTTSTSASSGSRVNSWPAFCASPSMTSESTRFFGQPSETNPIFIYSQVYNGFMAKRLLLALAFVACAAATGIANVPAGGHASTAAVLDRFLAIDAQPLVSYRAFPEITASTRGGKMTASIETWTSLDLEHGFSYDVTKSEGSSIIQSKVLLRALDTEKENAQSATSKAQSALTPANYEFLEISPLTDSTVRIDVR